MGENQVKVALEGPHGDVETLWANPLGNNLFKLDNLPWYAYRVSVEDVVEALPDAQGQLKMQRVVRKSGNRTIRVMLDVDETEGEPTFESKQTRERLVEMGCSFEGAFKTLTAVNIPPTVSLQAVADFLIHSGFEWEYADPTYEDLFPDQSGQIDEPMSSEEL